MHLWNAGERPQRQASPRKGRYGNGSHPGTFIAFLLIDHLFSKKPAVVMQLQPAVAQIASNAEPRYVSTLVGGFRVPENLRYHPGHTWALSESPSLVRVGIDDFAFKMIGKIESVSLPQRGTWVRQGQKIWSVVRDGKKVDMVAPIEGSVTGINEELVNNPERAAKDPYGEGWMVTVQSPDAKTNYREPARRTACWLVDRRSRGPHPAEVRDGDAGTGAGRWRSHGRPHGADARRRLRKDCQGILPRIRDLRAEAAMARCTPDASSSTARSA
jgi:glycine cleavage system H lipoate-binding protein